MLSKEFRFIEPGRPYRELRILSEIGRKSAISQRALAQSALIGPTMVHRYVTQLSREGLIAIKGENNRSFRYRLTQSGAERRDELFHEVSKEAVQFYGLVKREFKERLRSHAASGATRVVLFGAAETAEIVLAAAQDSGLEVVGIVDSDPAKHGHKIGDLIVTSPAEIARMAPDTVVITSFGHTEEIHDLTRLIDQSIRIVRV